MTEGRNVERGSPLGEYHTTFDPDSESGSDAVVSSLSEVTGTDPEELEPIGSIMDPIVFDALIRRQERLTRVSFVYHEHRVTVDTDGEIWVQDPNRPVFELTFAESEPLSHGVVRAIAAAKGIDPSDVDPLYESLDPEALDALLDGTSGGGARDVRVSFRIDDLEIEVSEDRCVRVDRDGPRTERSTRTN